MNEAEMDEAMYLKGYDYRLSPQSKRFEPLYVKRMADISGVLRSYPAEQFDMYRITADTIAHKFAVLG